MNRYFCGGDVRQHFNSITKIQLHVVATLLDPRLKIEIFLRREVDQAELLLVQLVTAARIESIKNKSQKRKEFPMEGSHGEADDRKHQKTDSNSTKAKYSTSRFWMRKAVAPPTTYLNQKKIHAFNTPYCRNLNFKLPNYCNPKWPNAVPKGAKMTDKQQNTVFAFR